MPHKGRLIKLTYLFFISRDNRNLLYCDHFSKLPLTEYSKYSLNIVDGFLKFQQNNNVTKPV